MAIRTPKPSPSESRLVSLGPNCCKLPERLLLAHGRGETIFITGAGTSMPAGLPDFRDLALEVYKKLDPPLYALLKAIPWGACNQWGLPASSLRPDQLAEAQRFIQGDYDVALGMLERRIDPIVSPGSRVRTHISQILRAAGSSPAEIHKSLIRLADRGPAIAIVTTNFDRLLQVAAQRLKRKVETYSLASIPRPGRTSEFSGVMHIHGALDRDAGRDSYCVVTDQDFGEFYLRRQVVPEFIYDAARLFNIVLIGYSANDPPMRYLLNAVAADGARFTDLKERFAFVGGPTTADPIVMSDWRARFITPIPYDSKAGHIELANTLSRWSEFSQINGDDRIASKFLRKAVRKNRVDTSVSDRDLFDYLFRRGSDAERRNFVSHISRSGAGPDWLDSVLEISAEPRHEASR